MELPLFFKYTDAGGVPPFVGSESTFRWQRPSATSPGPWQDVGGELQICHWGLHLVPFTFAWRWPAPYLFEAEARGAIRAEFRDGGLFDKVVCREARLLRRVPAWRNTDRLARICLRAAEYIREQVGAADLPPAIFSEVTRLLDGVQEQIEQKRSFPPLGEIRNPLYLADNWGLGPFPSQKNRTEQEGYMVWLEGLKHVYAVPLHRAFEMFYGSWVKVSHYLSDNQPTAQGRALNQIFLKGLGYDCLDYETRYQELLDHVDMN